MSLTGKVDHPVDDQRRLSPRETRSHWCSLNGWVCNKNIFVKLISSRVKKFVGILPMLKEKEIDLGVPSDSANRVTEVGVLPKTSCTKCQNVCNETLSAVNFSSSKYFSPQGPQGPPGHGRHRNQSHPGGSPPGDANLVVNLGM